MNACVFACTGTVPEGADILRERLRWVAAERRWHGSSLLAPGRPPTLPSPGQGALPCGAQLTLFTETEQARAS